MHMILQIHVGGRWTYIVLVVPELLHGLNQNGVEDEHKHI